MTDFFSLSPEEISKLSKSDLLTLFGEKNLVVKLMARKLAIERFYIKYVDKEDRYCKDRYNRFMEQVECVLKRLDNNNIIPNADDVLFFKNMPKTVKDHTFLLFNGRYVKLYSSKTNNYIDLYLDKLKIDQFEGRKSELKRRLLLACEEYLVKDKWFCVFNTLTVSPESYGLVFGKDSSGWRKYIENVDNYIGAYTYGSVRKAKSFRKKGEEFHKYFAVTEKGGNTGRLHIHVVHFFKCLPGSFTDPNYGSVVANKREISGLKSFWPYGYSSPIAVRFSQDDAFGMKHWRWPVKMVNSSYQPIKSHPPIALINYVAKYLNKCYDYKQERGVVWRVKMSRNLGSPIVKRVLESLPLEVQKKIIVNHLRLKYEGRIFPIVLVRRMLLKLLSQSMNCVIRIYCEGIKMWQLQPNIVDKIRDLMLAFRDCKSRSYGSIRTIGCRVQEGFNYFNMSLGHSIGGVS